MQGGIIGSLADRGRAALTSSNSEASLGSAATNCSQVWPCRRSLLPSCLITYRLCSIAGTALSPQHRYLSRRLTKLPWGSPSA